MAYARRRRFRRRPIRRRRFMRRRRRAVRRLPLGGFPTSKLVRFRYVQEIQLNAGVAGIATHLFRANSLFDPDFLLGGHQPMGYNEWMARYNHYTVIGSRCVVTYAPSVTASVLPAYFGVNLSGDAAATYTSVEHLLEQRFTRRSHGVAGMSYHLVNDKRATVQCHFAARKFFGSSFVVGVEPYRGGAASNPTEQAYFEIWTASVGGNDPATLNLLVNIDFIAVLGEPAQLPQS